MTVYEPRFPRISTMFRGDWFVHTEGVTGSIPVTPTILFNDLAGIYEVVRRFAKTSCPAMPRRMIVAVPLSPRAA